MVDEVAVLRELPDERIDLPERERDGRLSLEVAPHEAVARHRELEGRAGRLVDDGGPALLREREHAEDAADRHGAIVLVDVRAECTDRGAGVMRRGEERHRLRWGARRPIGIRDAMPATRRSHMLAHARA